MSDTRELEELLRIKQAIAAYFDSGPESLHYPGVSDEAYLGDLLDVLDDCGVPTGKWRSEIR